MEAYIYDAVRTVRGKGNKKGALMGVTPTELAAQVLIELKEKNDLDTTQVEDVILGCVGQVMDQAANIAKTAAQHSGYGDHLCGVTLNRFCGSGLESINQAAAYVKSGFRNLMVAGGVESMSRVKMGSDGAGMFMDPSVAIPGHIVPQGISADLIATKHGYSRADVDTFAYESQMRASKAEAAGLFNKSRIAVKDINGITVLGTDENIRPQTTIDALGNLKPSFAQMGQMAGFDAVAIDRYPEVEEINHVHHAGNSSAIVDGAAITLIGNKAAGESLGLKPRFRIRAAAIHGTDPTIMLIGPAPASKKALNQAGMNVGDIDLFEVNEAFAAVPMLFLDEMGVDHSKINVNGGAIALGHPLGATGCMLTGTLMDELERRDLNTGLITLCIGGGMGIATIIERV
ncbi:MAG: acetyl-CoA C-acetyltransferase [Bacteroidetes bacterium]|jgi:acetyl-CoA C-acetyltransferase|nr:acetyl-CoA C-acetyltransferase [Bacteroidota bacterium]